MPRTIIRLVLILVFPILVAAGTYLFMRKEFFEATRPEETASELFEVVPRTTLHNIFQNLAEKQFVRHWWDVEILYRLSRKNRTINAGEYEISRSWDPRKILNKLLSGDVYKRIVTIKEGFNIREASTAIEAAGLMAAGDFANAVSDPMLLGKAGISANSFEGYLFPQTYYFSRPIEPAKIIWTMLEEGEKHWTPEYSDQSDKLVLSRHEILTLASIIEKESGNVEEQPVISSVFHNRLAKGMKLQSDPTVIYGIPNFDGNLTRKDLETPSPYNTYTNFGLPPGPIANPGETAIHAALFPAQTQFLYFVADGTGHHVFAASLQEHNDNVNRFQRGRAAAAAAAAAATPSP